MQRLNNKMNTNDEERDAAPGMSGVDDRKQEIDSEAFTVSAEAGAGLSEKMEGILDLSDSATEGMGD